MTREEAIRTQKFHGTNLIDMFVALGMLHLDEPKCASEQAVDAMFSFASKTGGMITPRHAIQVMQNAGLKIVTADSVAK